MEKKRNNKLMIVVILLACVVGLSVGFAAFSTILNIKSSARVTPSKEDFKPGLSGSEDGSTDPVPPDKTGEGVDATDAVITEKDGNTEISNLSATFKKPGQKVVYTFYMRNTSPYILYLKNITFKDANGSSAKKVCTGESGATNSLVQAACNDIVLSVKPGGSDPITETQENIVNHSIAKGETEPVVVTIEYLPGGNVADGNFSVQFGDVSIEYRTAD